MDNDSSMTDEIRHEPGRRRFFAGAAAIAAGLVGGMAGPTGSTTAEAAMVGDVDVLNFALNLEYLEAEFYLRAALATGLAASETTGRGTPGAVVGGRQVPFATRAIRNYAVEIANDERNHVRFLRGALGSSAVARPKIDLRTSFTNAARAAGVITAGQTFDPFADETSFLLAAFIFEDVGVTAYKGAAPLIANKGYLEAAAGILAVEAYHAATVRTLLYQKGLYDASDKISGARDRLDGTGDKDQGVGSASFANIVPTDDNGIAFSRTPEQVLNIVYLGGSTGGFGFFPNRLNGLVR